MSAISEAGLVSLGMLRWLTPLSLAFVLAVPAVAADSCDAKSFEISAPDASTLKLTDGVHTIAKAKAPTGIRGG